MVIQGHSLAHVLSPIDNTATQGKNWLVQLFENETGGAKVAPNDNSSYDRETLENSLLELIQQCQAVIACRVSPLQVCRPIPSHPGGRSSSCDRGCCSCARALLSAFAEGPNCAFGQVQAGARANDAVHW